MGNKQKQDLLDVSMDLKLTSRQLERQSVKLEGSEKAELAKIKNVRNKIHLNLFALRLLTEVRWRMLRSLQKM